MQLSYGHPLYFWALHAAWAGAQREAISFRCTELVACSVGTIVSSLPVPPVGDSTQLELN